MGKSPMVVAGMLCALALTLASANAGESPGPRFCDVVPDFVAAWDRQDQDDLHGFIDSSLGFWVIYNVGIERRPYHFNSIGEPLGQGEHGFGYLGAAGFGECQPKPGSPPTCDEQGQQGGHCRFGSTGPTFRAAFDARVMAGAAKPEDLARFRRERDAVLQAAGETVYFLSDEKLGAVFYFTLSENRWTLLVIDTSDCSA